MIRLGNVGTLVSFRLGVADARLLAPYLAPVFEAEDFLNLDDYHAYVRPTANGRAERPFSTVTLPPRQSEVETRDAVKAHTKACYASSRKKSDSRTFAGREKSEGAEDDQGVVYFEE